MTLSFSQAINGKPNFFIEKIWAELINTNQATISDYQNSRMDFNDKFGKDWDDWKWPSEDIGMKLHTIRDYRKNGKTGLKADKQWKAGDKIHLCINNRSPNYFQFAPVIKCVSVQTIFIYKDNSIWVDNKLMNDLDMQNIAVNDGFDSLEDFFNYFTTGVERKLIHWTDLKY